MARFAVFVYDGRVFAYRTSIEARDEAEARAIWSSYAGSGDRVFRVARSK